MLATLTCISGVYSYFTMSRAITNGKLIHRNMLQTSKGIRHLKKANILKDGKMFELFRKETRYTAPIYVGHDVKLPIGGSIDKIFIPLCYGINFVTEPKINLNLDYNHNFIMDDGEKKYFNSIEDYMKFCNDFNLDPANNLHTKLMVKFSNITKNDEVWMLLDDNNNCKVIGKMSEKQFKTRMYEDSQFLFGKTNYAIFIVLLCLCVIVYGNFDFYL